MRLQPVLYPRPNQWPLTFWLLENCWKILSENWKLSPNKKYY